MRYVTLIQVCAQAGAKPPARFKLTYELTPIRPGLTRWFLVSKEVIEICQ